MQRLGSSSCSSRGRMVGRGPSTSPSPLMSGKTVPDVLTARKRALSLSKAAPVAATMTSSEAEALKEYKAKYYYPYDSIHATPEVEELVGLLTTAGRNRGCVPPPIVEGALLRLEQLKSNQEVAAVNGRWRLVFGTGTKVRAFQYIPVKEDFVLDVPGGVVALESEVGPFEFFIKGKVAGWDEKQAALAFQFTKVDIVLKGDKIWEVSPKTKPKTYTFFYVGENMAAARSSSGGVALLMKL